MTTPTQTDTIGSKLLNDQAIHATFDTIADQVAQYSAQITDVRPPNPDIASSFDDMLKEAARIKGRGLMYPSISSGVG
ncbi:MAG: hypothetical protein P1U30_05300, partial [Phycisphaerales bacterium]|nr:hypothetical protein [Phycisphaerales bacterium]